MGETPLATLAADRADRRIRHPWLLTHAVIPAVEKVPRVLRHETYDIRREEPMRTTSVLLMLCVSAVAMATPAVGDYRLLQAIAVPGDEGWDHPTVDSAARRLYVT